MKTFPKPKDPSDEAWYSVDVSGVVGDDPVATIDCALPTGTGALVKLDERIEGNTYFIKLGGGVVGEYVLVLTITTAGDQEFERSIKLKVKQA